MREGNRHKIGQLAGLQCAHNGVEPQSPCTVQSSHLENCRAAHGGKRSGDVPHFIQQAEVRRRGPAVGAQGHHCAGGLHFLQWIALVAEPGMGPRTVDHGHVPPLAAKKLNFFVVEVVAVHHQCAMRGESAGNSSSGRARAAAQPGPSRRGTPATRGTARGHPEEIQFPPVTPPGASPAASLAARKARLLVGAVADEPCRGRADSSPVANAR